MHKLAIKLINELNSALEDSMNKTQSGFKREHECLVEHLRTKDNTLCDFATGDEVIVGKLYEQGYIVIACQGEVRSAFYNLSKSKKEITDIGRAILNFDAVNQPQGHITSSEEFKEFMSNWKQKQQAEMVNFHGPYKLDCYSKSTQISRESMEDGVIAMKRCDAIYKDITTSHDSQINEMVKGITEYYMHQDL